MAPIARSSTAICSSTSSRGISATCPGKEQGRIEGQFVLTRQANTGARDLTEEALRGIKLEPDDDNTLLLYDNDEVGVRFLYPRRWRVAGVRGRQLGIDETNG